jgi:hypothetical protein
MGLEVALQKSGILDECCHVTTSCFFGKRPVFEFSRPPACFALRLELQDAVPTADYPLLAIAEMPQVEVHIVSSRAEPSGVGEAGVPPVAPAVANAVLAATDKRLRSLQDPPAGYRSRGLR